METHLLIGTLHSPAALLSKGGCWNGC